MVPAPTEHHLADLVIYGIRIASYDEWKTSDAEMNPQTCVSIMVQFFFGLVFFSG